MNKQSMYWCHGVNTQIQFTNMTPQKQFIGEPQAQAPLHVERNSSGTTVQQNGKSGAYSVNWFHLSIPLPDTPSSAGPGRWTLTVEGKINANALLDTLCVYMGGDPEQQKVIERTQLSLCDQHFTRKFILERPCKAPCVLCFRVLFENNGEVTFTGAHLQATGNAALESGVPFFTDKGSIVYSDLTHHNCGFA